MTVADTTNIDGTVAEAIVKTYYSMMNTNDAISASWAYADRTYDLIPTYPDGKAHVEFKIVIMDQHKRKMTICDIHDVTGIFLNSNGLTVMSDTTSYTVGTFGDYNGPYGATMGTGNTLDVLKVGDRVFTAFNKNSASVFILLGATVIQKDDDGIVFSGPRVVDGSAVDSTTVTILPSDTASVSYLWYLR